LHNASGPVRRRRRLRRRPRVRRKHLPAAHLSVPELELHTGGGPVRRGRRLRRRPRVRRKHLPAADLSVPELELHDADGPVRHRRRLRRRPCVPRRDVSAAVLRLTDRRRHAGPTLGGINQWSTNASSLPRTSLLGCRLGRGRHHPRVLTSIEAANLVPGHAARQPRWVEGVVVGISQTSREEQDHDFVT
jgi:hypothetical protein